MVLDFHGHLFETLFPFVDSILEPTEEDIPHFIAQLEAFLAFAEAGKDGKIPVLLHPLSEETHKNGSDKMAGLPEGAKIAVPLDIALSLLRPDELEKLQKYIASYLAKHGSSEI